MVARLRWLLLLGLLVLAACSAATTPAIPEVAGPIRPAQEAQATVVPRGSVTVAQPDPVASWWQEQAADVAAGDLAALWSLPLYRNDDLGRWSPALAVASRVVTVDDGWAVEVDLAAGAWSDGTPVTSSDVVATSTALAAVRPASWGAWQETVAVDEDTVRLVFDRPFAGWLGLLSRPPGVLPAHVLSDGGLDAYAEELPVTGGWFTLDEREPGRSAYFAAHTAGPLGPPALAEVRVLVVPSHDTALGLLEDGRADVVLGYVVLDGPSRRAGLSGVIGVEALGGTRFELVWPDGAGTRAVRRAAAGRLDPGPFVDALLRDAGRQAGGLLPLHVPLPVPSPSGADGAVALQVPRTVEGLGLLARRLQTALTSAGVDASLVRLDPPEHLASPLAADARLRVVRVDPSRSVAGLLTEVGLPVVDGLAADAAGPGGVDAMARGVTPPTAWEPARDLLGADPRIVPLAEVAVTHVWEPDAVAGLRPSGWPGVGLWNVGAWYVPGDA